MILSSLYSITIIAIGTSIISIEYSAKASFSTNYNNKRYGTRHRTSSSPSPIRRHSPFTLISSHATTPATENNDDILCSRRKALFKGATGILTALTASSITPTTPKANAVVTVSPPPPTTTITSRIANTATTTTTATSATASSVAAVVAEQPPIETKLTMAALSLGAVALAENNKSTSSSPPLLPPSLSSTSPLPSIKKRPLLSRLHHSLLTLRRTLHLLTLLTPLLLLYPLTTLHPSLYTAHFLPLLLRQSERGGAVAIKLCQWASSRPDIFGTSFCDVMKKLQDGTEVVHDWEYTEKVLMEGFGGGYDKSGRGIGLRVDERDDGERVVLGSGCIAQVYKGVIIRSDDDDNATQQTVAIKVIHPNIRQNMSHDISILKTLARWAQKIPFGIGYKLKWNNLDGMVDEFATMLQPQLDLRNEACNIRQFNDNFKNVPDVVFPQLVEDYEPTRDVLVETFCEGEPIETFCKENRENRALRARLCDLAAETMCQMIFKHNFVHGDLHPGNVFVTPSHKLILLDCGIVNKYTPTDHNLLINIIASFIRMDGKRAATLMAADSDRRAATSSGEQTKNVDEYISAIDKLSQTPRSSDFVFEKVATYANYIFNAAATHHVTMNPAFVSMALAIKVQEGVALMLNPNCELIKIANPIIMESEAERLLNGSNGESGALGEALLQIAGDYVRDWRVKVERGMRRDVGMTLGKSQAKDSSSSCLVTTATATVTI